MDTTTPAPDTKPVEPPVAATTPPQPAASATKPPPSKAAAATVDDDEDSDDDLDDLDDMLDEFDDGSAGSKAAAAGSGKAGEPVIDEEWARMLQEGMADLLNDVNQSPEMQGQFEKLAKELNEAMATGDATNPTAAAPAAAPAAVTDSKATDNFQERIKATMDRMKSSNAEVDAGLADADSDDFLAEMLKSMGGTGADNEEDFSTMLVTMMEQLTSKEILYEPMKELYEKYPEWMRKNEATESKDDMERYRAQFVIVKEIVSKFDEPDYKDEDESCREFIVERMQKMQTAGAPPQELMGDVGQGFDPPDVPSDCGVQ